MPHRPHAAAKQIDARSVGWHAVVAGVPVEHLSQPGMLLLDRIVPPSLYLLLELRQLGAFLLPRGPALELEFAGTASACDMSKAEEIEGLGFSEPATCTAFSGESSKLNHPRLLRMKLQAEVGEAPG